MRTSRPAFITAAALCILLTSCTAGGDADLPHVPDASPSTVEPPPREPLTAPAVEPGYEEILADGPRRGPWDVGEATHPSPRDLRVAVHCMAKSRLIDFKVTIDGVGEFSVRCSGVRETTVMNAMGDVSRRELHLTVDTEESVRWYISVQAAER
ncbi:hypothetical protein [Streptomyces sp. NRRL S-1314]|uniref:hypothetical protein n=1 Tax=Streptomyces TaxID=1883 RepID=UPI0004C98568|nr:hypothetical protein [Streptomyces sp. NRRL S-1314]